MLISFEGIDGCGKSTQIELLKNYLRKKNVKSTVLREPGGTETSEAVRKLLLHGPDNMNPVTELLLFSAARSQLISEKVLPLLESGEVVILDRFYDSTTAYQGYGRGSASLDEIHQLNKLASHSVEPDITFYLKIDPKVAEARTSNDQKDRMESSGDSFFRKVADGFDEISRMEKRFKTVDASQPPDQIHAAITEILEPLL